YKVTGVQTCALPIVERIDDVLPWSNRIGLPGSATPMRFDHGSTSSIRSTATSHSLSRWPTTPRIARKPGILAPMPRMKCRWRGLPTSQPNSGATALAGSGRSKPAQMNLRVYTGITTSLIPSVRCCGSIVRKRCASCSGEAACRWKLPSRGRSNGTASGRTVQPRSIWYAATSSASRGWSDVSAPSCRFCSAPLSQVVIDLGMSPLSNSLLEPSRLDQTEAMFPLRVYACERCWLVQVPQFESPDRIFRDYAYFSSYSSTWLEHARRYAADITDRLGLTRRSL